jgi:tetratricopeptide (TPR) repeat protein
MRALLSLAALLAATPAVAARPAPASDTPLHAYVIGRYAALDNDIALAGRLLEEARAAQPDVSSVTRRAWEMALTAGDRQKSFQLARSLMAAGEADAEIVMVRLVEAALRKDWAQMAQLRQKLGSQGWPQVAGPVIDAWAAAARGDSAAALLLLDPQRHQGFMRGYMAEQRAHLLGSLGRWDEAAAAYRQARAGGGPAPMFLRQGQADALLMAGRREEALAVLYAGDPPTAAARARLLAGKRLGPLAPDPRHGLAWLTLRLSGDLARERAEPLALLFARLSTWLAPELPVGWLATSDALGRAGLQQAALDALRQAPAGFGLEALVRARSADLLEAAGQSEAAGQLLTDAARSADSTAEDWQLLAAWHRRAGRFDDAAAAYGTAIERFGKQQGSAAWNLHYMRGAMRDAGGDWPGAEADLRAALALSPDEPTVLNHLGYSLLERQGNAGEARALVEKAAKLRPGDGSILDSLGWLQLQTGDVDAAVTTLERAASLEPQSWTIISHLGDALWRQGRLIEARFRWRQALGLDPDLNDRRQLQARLDFGLDAAPAMLARK